MKEFDNGHLNLFLDTAVERHNIYLKRKESQQKPWTNNEIFQNYFFCNVFRQYDKCSKWIIDNIIPYNRWDLIILYRFISTIEIFHEIKDNCKLDDIQAIYNLLSNKKNRCERIFNGCFIRNPRTCNGTVETYKVPFILIDEIKKDGLIKDKLEYQSLEIICKYLMKFKGVGGFMAYEYACDFEYSNFFNPEDKYGWANMGPGARQGMSFLVHGHRSHRFTQKTWLPYAIKLWPIMQERFAKEFNGEDVTMREVEHWLCEYQKYVKYFNSRFFCVKCKFRKYDGGIR